MRALVLPLVVGAEPRSSRPVAWLFLPILAALLARPIPSQDAPPRKPATRPAAPLSDKEAIREATGLALSTFAADLRRRLRGEEDRRGLLIGTVDDATPAARAGLAKGDVLLRWNKQPVTSVAELARWICQAEPGTRVVIEYRRLERSKILKRRQWKTHKSKIELGQPGIRQAFGLTFAVVESILRRNLVSTDTPYGFKIKHVDPGSAAAHAGLEKGDIVLKWDGEALHKIVQIRQWLARAKPGAKVPVRYSRRRKDAKLGDRKRWIDRAAVLLLPAARKR